MPEGYIFQSEIPFGTLRTGSRVFNLERNTEILRARLPWSGNAGILQIRPE